MRKATLQKQYYFDCDCKKCLEDDEKTKKAIRCSSCQNCVPISTMICVKCGAKEDPVRKKKYLQLSQEYEDLVIKNKGGHPEPDDQVCKKLKLNYTVLQMYRQFGLFIM